MDTKITPPFTNKVNINQKNSLNYKIAKCKNWEKEGSCKYGAFCTFAHGNNELRNKSDNMIQMQPGMGMMVQPFMMNMESVMQLGQMNQLQGMDLGFNPMMVGMGITANNELQRQINEGMKINVEKRE